MNDRRPPRGLISDDALPQCLVRELNEQLEHANAATTPGTIQMQLRCECDPSCTSPLDVAYDAYEHVRAYPSRFLIALNQENSENAYVVSEHAAFAVVDVIADNDRYTVLTCANR